MLLSRDKDVSGHFKARRVRVFELGVYLCGSHTFREGNQAADLMAKGVRQEGFSEEFVFGRNSFIISDLRCVGYCRDIQ